MAQSSNTLPFDSDGDWEDSADLDSTCPECGTESIATYIDRYSSYEYCTSCDWSDEDGGVQAMVQPIGRRNRYADEA